MCVGQQKKAAQTTEMGEAGDHISVDGAAGLVQPVYLEEPASVLMVSFAEA